MLSRRAQAVLTAGCWAATLATLGRGIGGLARMRASLAWLADRGSQWPGSPAGGRDGSAVRVVVLLPLLREQRLLGETVSSFRGLQQTWPCLAVVLVTTQREHADRAAAAARLDALADALAAGRPTARILRRYLGVLPRDRLLRLARQTVGQPVTACRAAVHDAFTLLPATDELAATLARDAQAEGADVRHYHHPDPQAGMADQLNLAAHAELQRLAADGVDPRGCYLAIYNADSRPDPATFQVLARTVAEWEQATGQRPEVVQQSALFTRNLTEFGRGARGAYLKGAALLQSRWSLAHEIPALRRQARTTTGPRRGWPWLGHCTGHGLFIRADAFARWHGLPTATMNEDLAFGFLLSAGRTPIVPLATLERADSPETAPLVLRQKRQWFWSYLEYPKAARLAAELDLGTPMDRRVLVVQGLARGLAWLATSPTLAATLALPLLKRSPAAIAASVAAFGAYYAIPFHVLVRELQRRGEPTVRLDAATLAGGLAAYLTHSLGPGWCCVSALRRRSGTRYVHDKTER